MSIKKEDLQKLQSQQVYNELGMAPKWRIQSVKMDKAICIPYYDARDVQIVLDYVCGQADWCNEPLNIGGKLYMQIGINIEGEGWVYKSDVGTESNIEKVKGEASDAMKRAAVMWGIFRNVYATGTKVLPASGKFAMTKNGKVLYTGDQLTAYCNGMNTEQGNLLSIYSSFKSQFESNPKAKKLLSDLSEFLKSIKE